VAAQLGYCGLDRQRSPLRGDEIRACWESLDIPGATPPPVLTAATAWPLEPGQDRTLVRLLDFVEVQTEVARDERVVGLDPPLHAIANEPRWSLWGDAEA